MKNILLNIIIVFIISAYLFSCKEDAEDLKNITNTELSKDTAVANKGDTTFTINNKSKKKHSVKYPDYVPPNDGGNNEKWCNNRHKMLTKDSDCYFGKGLQKRNRYRWGRQNLE